MADLWFKSRPLRSFVPVLQFGYVLHIAIRRILTLRAREGTEGATLTSGARGPADLASSARGCQGPSATRTLGSGGGARAATSFLYYYTLVLVY